MIATTFKQRLGRILAFVLAMAPGLAMPATDFDCQGEATFIFNASQNDFAPGRACVVKLSTSTASLSITGFTGGNPGRIVMVENAGTTAFSLTDASSSSSVGNRFQFPANITLPGGATIFLRYDAGTREWKAVSAPASEDAAFADDVAITGDVTVGGTAQITGETTLTGGATVPAVEEIIIGTNGATISQQTAGTPDQTGIFVGTLSEGLLIAQDGDKAFDFAHADQTNPTVFVHSATQSTTEWVSLAHNQTNGVLDVGTGVVSVPDGVSTTTVTATGAVGLSGATTLNGTIVSPIVLATNGTRLYHGTAALTKAGGAEAIFTITNATTQATGVTMEYRIAANDGTDYAVRTARLLFSCNNLAGTTTSTASPTDETGSIIETTNAKTLTFAITDTNAANTCTLLFNIDSDMAGTVTGTIYWSAFVFGPGTIS